MINLKKISLEKYSNQWQPGWNHMFMCGASIKDSIVGIVGAGRIGTAIIERLIGFKPKLILYNGNERKEKADSLGAHYVSLNKLLEESDFVIVCCALTEKTHQMFNSEAFQRMKSSAIFINTSRGGIVDQNALYQALSNGEIKGAGLDVMNPEPISDDDPLLSLNNVGMYHVSS